MLSEGLETHTIKFFNKIYPLLLSLKKLNTSQMAECADIQEKWAAIHRDRLVKSNYLVRNNYREWELNVRSLNQPVLKKLFRIYLNGGI